MLSGCDTTTPCAHLHALTDLNLMRLLTAQIGCWSHGRHIAEFLQRNAGGVARTGRTEHSFGIAQKF